MLLSIEAEKTLENPTHLHDKTISKLGMEGHFFNLTEYFQKTYGSHT